MVHWLVVYTTLSEDHPAVTLIPGASNDSGLSILCTYCSYSHTDIYRDMYL